MPRREKYVPRHRNTPAEPALKKGLRKSFVFSGVAVAATGITVGSGVLSQDEVPASTAASSLSSATSDQADGPSVDTDAADREQQTSRSDRRESLDPEKKKALSQDPGGAVTRTEDIASQDPRDIARSLLPKYGFSQSEFGCLDEL
ncbi:MAG TPA: lytic transglycosylase domain-containing protein, partial [Nocardioides sp.]|nr:lytic transglycosylase domain-containing protein [Nocardioides sp.]